MKKGWRIERLGDVCTVEKAQGIHRQLPYIGLEHIESQTARFIGSLEPQSVKSSTFKFSNAHILYGRLRPYLNKVLAPDFEGHCSTEIFPIKPVTELSREYLLYWFLADETVARINATCTGARMPRADMNDVLGFDIPLPPLAEQRRIVGILDEAFEGIASVKANTQKSLQNARALVQPAFIAVANSLDQSSWRSTTVEDVALPERGSIRTGPFGSQLLHSEFVDQGIPVLGIDNAVLNRFAWSERRYITPRKFVALSRYQVRPGDVLITIMGTCGRCAIVPNDIPAAINSKHLCCITLDHQKCLPEFLHAYFLFHPTARDFLARRAKGSIMSGLNMGIIKELPVLLPSLHQQRKFLETFDVVRAGVERLESVYQRKLSALDELRRSFLHQAFTGAL